MKSQEDTVQTRVQIITIIIFPGNMAAVKGWLGWSWRQWCWIKRSIERE